MLELLQTCPATLQAHLNGGLLTLVFNRPERKNAIEPPMYLWLEKALDTASVDPSVKVVKLMGAGGVFTAGNDMASFDAKSMDGIDSPAFRLLRAAARFSKPLVCAVQGVAVGIGTTMLLHADLVYAQQGTRFQLPFVSLGLVPEGAASLLLPARAGYLQAAELLLLAQMFDAQTALDAKLVNAVVDDAEAAADKAIARLLELPTKSLQMTKALLKPVELVQKSIDCINAEAKDFVQRTAEEDMQEAVAAFMQKRKPVFK